MLGFYSCPLRFSACRSCRKTHPQHRHHCRRSRAALPPGTVQRLIDNRDDHLRNHGFLREENGWRLAPAFDVNPNPDRQTHVLALDEAAPSPVTRHPTADCRLPTADCRLLTKTVDYYRLSRKRTEGIGDEVRGALRTWHAAAANLRIPSGQVASLAAIIDPER